MLDLLADDPSADVLQERVFAEFDLVKSVGRDDGAVLVTGYHEPIIDAAEAPGGEYRVPILGVPRDLSAARRGAYWTRAEIEQGRLGDRARPLAWARDPVDVFFMEIEGSGTLRFPGGRELRVGYAATNARPYRSIGWLLIQEGKIPREAMTMRALREWLAAYPEERTRVLRHNESYVFFRPLPGAPVGSLGVPLTPGRSIATDPRVFPRASLAFIRTMRPVEMPDGSIAWTAVRALRPQPGRGRSHPGPGPRGHLLGARSGGRPRGQPHERVRRALRRGAEGECRGSAPGPTDAMLRDRRQGPPALTQSAAPDGQRCSSARRRTNPRLRR